MTMYAAALRAYLESPDALNQSDLADKAGCTQASISRYSAGERFPDAETAARISKATDDRVPLDIWRKVAAQRAGLGDISDLDELAA